MPPHVQALYPPTLDPPAQPLSILRFVASCARNPLTTIPQSAYRDLVTCFSPVPGYKVLWLADPDVMNRVLVRDAARFRKTDLEDRIFGAAIGKGVLTAEGDEWRWQRRLLAPLFRHADIVGYVPQMVAAADQQIARWRGTASLDPQHRCIDRDMTEATFDVIIRTMLFGGAPGDLNAVREAGARYLDATSWVVAFGMLGLPAWLPHPKSLALRQSARQLRTAVAAIIDDRRRSPVAANDLLGRLLDARDPETGAPLPHALLIDNLATLLEAGHETTAKVLTWALYLLARAPEWQDRVRTEVQSVAGDAPLQPEHIDRLTVTERVIKEAMRLYPPAPILVRTPTEPVELAGHTLKPKNLIVMPVYAIHRHRQLWTDPDRFDPDRFLPERESQLKRTQYMPFGAGPRICLGASFAMIEAKVLLASFIRAARFDWDGKHLPEPVSRVTLRPAGGMPLLMRML